MVRFLDTNVLLHIASNDEAKADRAEALLGEGGTISVQVLNELANVARRKLGMDWQETEHFVSRFPLLLDVVPVTLDVHVRGLRVASRYELSVYDGMIVAAALEAGCTMLFSEDMQHGMLLEKKLRMVNPFA